MSAEAPRPDPAGGPAVARSVGAWAAPGFVAGEVGGEDPGAFLERIFALEPAETMRRVAGRETFAWPGRPEVVVKRTWGGEARDWWYEFLGPDAPRSPGRREAENLGALAADGLPVPRALAWVEERGAARHPRLGGAARRSAVVMERVAHEETLRDRLATAPSEERRALLRRLADLVVALHGAGWYHRDLYLQHFVLPSGGDSVCVLLDVGRARKERAPRARWLVKDLAALLHSTPACVSRAERLRFLDRWLAARGEETRRARRRWVRAVLRKERRLAAHRPRRVDSGGGAR